MSKKPTKFGTLIDIVARALDLPRESVATHAKYLREHNAIATRGKFGRGKGGAVMGFPDAVNLLLAAAASPAPKDSTAELDAFLELDPWVGDGGKHRYGTVKSCLVGEMEHIVEEMRRGVLHPDYLRGGGGHRSNAAVSLTSAVGLGSRKHPRVLRVRRLLTAHSMIDVRTFTFVSAGWHLQEGEVTTFDPPPGLRQTRDVSFSAFANVALAL